MSCLKFGRLLLKRARLHMIDLSSITRIHEAKTVRTGAQDLDRHTEMIAEVAMEETMAVTARTLLVPVADSSPLVPMDVTDHH